MGLNMMTIDPQPVGNENCHLNNVDTKLDTEIKIVEYEQPDTQRAGSQQVEDFFSIEKIIDYATRTNVTFKKLFNGKVSNKKYPMPKDAEKALINCLTPYTQNPERIEAILRKSKIFRDTWNTGSYLQDLINEVLVLKSNISVTQNNTDKKQAVDQDIDEDIDYDEAGFSQEELDEAESEALRILATGQQFPF
jgi:hypothetical protein